jgi:uncharacterized protein
VTATQVLLALVFAVGHWGNPGMEGATMVLASISLGVGAILFGLAYLRTGSLALPIGMHLGWNWSQGNLLGFGVSGVDQAGWWRPVFTGQPEWLTGGAFGPEASVLALVVDLIVLAVLWRWRGSLAGRGVTRDRVDHEVPVGRVQLVAGARQGEQG